MARRLVRDAQLRHTDLVLDIGAGLGAVTRPLAHTGARIIAIERDERIARRLTTRMAEHPNVTVVTGNALAVPLPHRPYRVVASIPFAITTPLLRRLVARPLVSADLVVELGAGRRLVLAPPGRHRSQAGSRALRQELARWHRRYDFTLGPVIPAHCFRPPPPVDSVVLRLRRR
jgi:16S rRNA A1518/A1519 N6-dimethyltransferase RsmA/KsgA/DIM1 with predicted DNA glycosylase/AP lyase activity